MEQQATRVRVSEKGRIVIPAALRDQLGIKVGDIVDLSVEHQELRLSTVKARIERAQKRLQRLVKPGRSMSEELIAERREEARHE